jgi:signal transduction histidine kinase/CheY-like chemotaxis protein
LTVSSKPRSSLSLRFFTQVALISVGLLLVAGGTEAYFAYREALSQMARLQNLQATAAGAEIEQYLQTIQRSLQPVQALPWGQAAFGPTQRREELHRALSLNPAVLSLVDVDAEGVELLAVSRTEPDRLAGGPQQTARKPQGDGAGDQGDLKTVAAQEGFGAPFFDDAAVPNVRLVLPRAGRPAGRTVAVVNLSFLGDVLAGLRVANAGEVYVVDKADRLLAHADPTQVLRLRQPRPDNAVAAARVAMAAGAASGARLEALDAPGLNGARAITTAITLPATQWTLFVEQAHGQAMQPVWATLQRTLLLVALAGLAAMVASAAFARRMAAPIAKLRQATASMAAGQLGQQLKVNTGDEIEGLAQDFNTMSARLQQSYGELEDKVQQRTTELASKRDEAERANAAKTRFLASASHDLRQPMHAIGLLVGLLRERVAEQELRGLADKTHQAVESMEALFGSLLDVSKLDSGAVKPQPQTLALPDLLQRIGQSYAPLAAAKGITLKVRAGRQLCVHTDPALLERLLGNLVSNAIRYTQEGGVLVGCRRRGGRVVVQVVDTGIGIELDQQQLVFEEFVRLDPARTGEQGLGLGLAIVKRTADLLGLSIALRSVPGKGSVFEVLLPVVDAPAQPELPTPLPGHLQDVLAGAFVVVVDDDSRNRDATADLLRHWGCLVVAAAGAEAALQEMTQHLRPPDAVVTDFRLGAGIDGLTLIDKLRDAAGAQVPALLVTAETQLPRAITARTQLLQKPVGTDKLLSSLAQLLSARA